MKTILATFFTALLLVIGTQSALAQGGGGGMRMDPEARTKELIAALEVTSAQEPAFREVMAKINERQMGAMRDMRQGGGSDGQSGAPADGGARQGSGSGQAAGMTRRSEMQKQNEEQLATVLTEVQMAKYRELEAKRMAEMRERMGR